MATDEFDNQAEVLESANGFIGKGMADLLGKQSSAGYGLMGVSKLLGVMNKAGAASGASVQYKRRSEDGSLVMDTDDKDMERADFQLKMAQLARMVEHLPRQEKLAFSTEMRRQGNAKFTADAFEEASELYMQSLVGLDFGGGDESSLAEARTAVQVPVLCNLAACALHVRKFLRCVLLCDVAIGLHTRPDESSGAEKRVLGEKSRVASNDVIWKAYSRKGAAQLELGEFVCARASLREAASLAPLEADQRAVRRELRRVHEAEKKAKAADQKQRKAISNAMNTGAVSLYDEKKKKMVSSLHEALPEGKLRDISLGVKSSATFGGKRVSQRNSTEEKAEVQIESNEKKSMRVLTILLGVMVVYAVAADIAGLWKSGYGEL